MYTKPENCIYLLDLYYDIKTIQDAEQEIARLEETLIHMKEILREGIEDED